MKINTIFVPASLQCLLLVVRARNAAATTWYAATSGNDSAMDVSQPRLDPVGSPLDFVRYPPYPVKQPFDWVAGSQNACFSFSRLSPAAAPPSRARARPGQARARPGQAGPRPVVFSQKRPIFDDFGLLRGAGRLRSGRVAGGGARAGIIPNEEVNTWPT